MGGLFIIMFVSSLGILVPLIGRRFESALFVARAFGAGVILATALVHVSLLRSAKAHSPPVIWDEVVRHCAVIPSAVSTSPTQCRV